jgi:hypothetical protein
VRKPLVAPDPGPTFTARADAEFQRQIVARLGATNLGRIEEMKALRLLSRLTGFGGARLHAGTIPDLVRYAAAQPAQVRANVWALLRQVSHPALAAPVVESLRHDSDQRVRLMALGNLEENFPKDTAARRALESIALEDSDGVVRVAVRRVLYGQSQWRDEILTALQDSALPYEAKLAPLIAVIRQHLLGPDHARATSEVLGLVGKIDDPAVFDLFLQLIGDKQFTRELSGRNGNVGMSGPVSSWVFSHRADPRVLDALAVVDPRLRTMLEAPRMSVTDVPVTSAEQIIPSNLIRRMREVTEKPVPAAPAAQ